MIAASARGEASEDLRKSKPKAGGDEKKRNED